MTDFNKDNKTGENRQGANANTPKNSSLLLQLSEIK